MSQNSTFKPTDLTVSREIIPDVDPLETGEWLEAFDSVLHAGGSRRGQYLLESLLTHARLRGVKISSILNSPYCNTIAREEEPPFPGDLELEKRILAAIRWNAAAMVVRANHDNSELGGHLATYASAAELFEVGFNHFFHGGATDENQTCKADLVYFQPHSSTGVYARAFLEGRLTEENLANYRREVAGKGLPSYPHPWLIPGFWQFPTGSMGIGAITAIYQARFMRYLENRGLMDPSERKVWAFVGDGEMDEPESLAGLSLAGREQLDNLIFVVNCNLQRLDGPVRGNGSIIQELERIFLASGWNVIKVLWGSDWDRLFALDRNGVLLKQLGETVDGAFQTYAAKDARYNREHFFNTHPELRQIASELTDNEIDRLARGGHDPVKIYAAYTAAVRERSRPSVILAQTKKGYGLGQIAQGRMSAHQQKKLDENALKSLRDWLALPLSDQQAADGCFYKPPSDSPEMRYLHDRRTKLGGYMPSRPQSAPIIVSPKIEAFAGFVFDQEERLSSTTVAFTRMLANLLKDNRLGKWVVPIVADEARTFGMQSLFRQVGIYAPGGQLYEPEDRKDFLYYKESREGQILEEGITEAGALASWIAAGISYSSHGLPMLPFYIFYSIFGFQRVGDLIWAAADSRARGFLLGATAGRTTLSGEGLQHQDGSSHLIASTVPTCRAYDPCFGYELAVILEDGMDAMLHRQNDFFYYITLMNENYHHPAMPPGVKEGILRGMYLVRGSGTRTDANESRTSLKVQLLGAGAILREVIAAADLLEQDWGVNADVWSVTSFTELRRDGMGTERWNRMHPLDSPRRSWVEHCLASTGGPVIAASDYVRAVPDLIRAWVPRRFITLGADGYGRSDTRAALRSFFEIDRNSIVIAALSALAEQGSLTPSVASEAIARYGCSLSAPHPWEI
jgi:pyruvate dehydrogenase E1 component